VDESELTAIEEIVRASADADGAEPLDEGAWRRLRHHADELDVRVEPGAGFVITDGDLMHLVVDPSHRRHGIGARLLRDTLGHRSGPWLAWSHGDHPAAAALARRTGFARVRELWVMRRRVAQTSDRPFVPALADLGSDRTEFRTFQPGDEAELLRVNAAAFAHHPEQGSMDAAELAERMAEPWFDPADLYVAVERGRMHGFHWTKRHSATLGEVYVVAIDPAAQGRGLGQTLVSWGLHMLRARGVEEVLLYVESDNAPAVHVYEKQGFTHAASDTHVMYERAARPVSEPAS
jgi:mycothiol synthase